jgi:isoleucyl-tRNA synthetase
VSIDYKHTIHLPQTEFPMKADLPKREPGLLAEWERQNRYAEIQRRTAARPHAFILHDGPPYANGAIHLGHAVNKILKDIVVKSKLLAGFRAPYVPGWDCHGLPIEVAVEKKVGKVGQKVDAAEFRRLCREYARSQIELQRNDFRRLGVLGAWDEPYRTMDFRYEADILRALARIYARGHVVRGFKPVHWCFDCGSALAEAEIEYHDKTSPAIDVAYVAVDPTAVAAKFGVELGVGDRVAVPIWTTTPWTLPASFAVTLGADLEYCLIEGPSNGAGRTALVVATTLADRCAVRYRCDQDGRAVRRGVVVRGAVLEHLVVQHPFYPRQVPLLLGEHVVADEGTGAVHTAPGHGVEDFAVGQRYGIVDALPAAELNPVGPNGVYLPQTPLFAGQFIFTANDAIVALLRERGVLLAADEIRHSYPHCWRHRTPVAFRTTPQWFIGMERANLRVAALRSIREDVTWFPGWGEDRIASMIAGRPDWCISRQRTWGVPIALFVHKERGEPHPRSAELMEQVAERVERCGADAWYALDPRELLGDEAAEYEKVTDILDVWFDSGVSHFCVLDQRAELGRAAGDRVMYLEGSDQHRGWFHSSLLTGVAMHGRAPYDEVLTHGFTVDAQGRKMSKSLGNGIEPQDVIRSYGADILRLWIAAADYRNEMALSDEILKRVADAYRRIRNTARFLLGNLHGFDPARHLLPVETLLLLDRWAVQQAFDVQQTVIAAYARYDFPEIVQRVQNFCTNELGALYLDITKDRLYTMPEDSHGRRSAQSAMYHILESLVRWLAPILAFTAEEIWRYLPGARGESVLFETWYDGLRALQDSAEQRKFWSDLLAIRAGAAKLLEGMRNRGAIGAGLDAELTLYADTAQFARLQPVAEELRFFFITSDCRLESLRSVPDEAQPVMLADAEVWIGARVSGYAKCIRCWQHRADVGTDAQHPQLCGRCVANLPGGPGERRQYF